MPITGYINSGEDGDGQDYLRRPIKTTQTPIPSYAPHSKSEIPIDEPLQEREFIKSYDVKHGPGTVEIKGKLQSNGKEFEAKKPFVGDWEIRIEGRLLEPKTKEYRVAEEEVAKIESTWTDQKRKYDQHGDITSQEDLARWTQILQKGEMTIEEHDELQNIFNEQNNTPGGLNQIQRIQTAHRNRDGEFRARSSCSSALMSKFDSSLTKCSREKLDYFAAAAGSLTVAHNMFSNPTYYNIKDDFGNILGPDGAWYNRFGDKTREPNPDENKPTEPGPWIFPFNPEPPDRRVRSSDYYRGEPYGEPELSKWREEWQANPPSPTN